MAAALARRSRQGGSELSRSPSLRLACLEAHSSSGRPMAAAGPALASPVRLPELASPLRLPELGTRVSRMERTDCFAAGALP